MELLDLSIYSGTRIGLTDDDEVGLRPEVGGLSGPEV